MECPHTDLSGVGSCWTAQGLLRSPQVGTKLCVGSIRKGHISQHQQELVGNTMLGSSLSCLPSVISFPVRISHFSLTLERLLSLHAPQMLFRVRTRAGSFPPRWRMLEACRNAASQGSAGSLLGSISHLSASLRHSAQGKLSARVKAQVHWGRAMKLAVTWSENN